MRHGPSLGWDLFALSPELALVAPGTVDDYLVIDRQPRCPTTLALSSRHDRTRRTRGSAPIARRRH
jgi:hypothetical protein